MGIMLCVLNEILVDIISFSY